MSRSYERKFDYGKTRWDLIPWDCVEQVAEILTFGADKYDANSWQKVDDAESRYFSALLRHLIAYQQGEDLDQESGKLHLSHVATNALFLLWFNLAKINFRKKLTDSNLLQEGNLNGNSTSTSPKKG